MTAHRDVWIFDDLESITIYYPELEEEKCILNTQTVFADYKTARTVHKNVAIEQVALGNYDLKDPNLLLTDEQYQAVSSRNYDMMSNTVPFYLFPESHEQYLHAVQWSRYLQKTGIKPGNSLFNEGYYSKYDSGGTEIDRGWFKTRQFFFPDHENNRAIYIVNLAHVGENSAGSPAPNGYESSGYIPDIRNDRTARLHSPLSYFPPFIDFGKKDVPVLWDPSDPVKYSSEILHKYSGRGTRVAAWANALIAACTAKNKKITYDQIIRSSGEYGYNITVDLSIIGLGTYEWKFEDELLRFFDPIKFFTKATREYLDNGNTVRWGAGNNLFSPKSSNTQNPWNMPVVYQFNIDDIELRFYGLATSQFRSRDSWIHNFLVGGMIPIGEPDYEILHHVRHDKFGSREPCVSSGKYIILEPHHESALEVFKKILGEIIGIGISFGISFISSPEGISTFSKIVGSTISTFKQLADRVLSSAGAPELVISAFNYGLYEACALKIDNTIKEGKDYQLVRKEIKNSLASTITKFSLSMSSNEETDEIDRAEQVSDLIVDYLTKEENKYAPHATENTRKILSSIATAKENYMRQAEKYYIGNRVVVGGMNVIDTSKSKSGIYPVLALAAGAVILANLLKNK